MLIDGGSEVNVLFKNAYDRMLLEGEEIDPCNESPFIDFGNQLVLIAGVVIFKVEIGMNPRSVEKELKFYLVDVDSPYNMILGRPMLTAFQTTCSLSHLKVKFPTDNRI